MLNDTVGPLGLELDVADLIQATQTLSSEMDPERLIHSLLTLSLKRAGAERGLLILVRDGIPRLEAQATTEHSRNHADTVLVEVRQEEPTAELLPMSILQRVLRTQRCVSMDATVSDEYAGDDYLRQHRPRSLLCQLIARQGRLIGVLYLENRLVAGLFTPSRTLVIDVLAAQAAISLENACLYRDVRERESEARRVAEAATRAKSDFLAMMSHELRNPLNAILGFAQILQRDPTLSERQRKRSDFIRDSGEHLLKVINDLLDLARIEAGKLSLNIAEIAIDQLLAAVRASTWVKAQEKGLELRWHKAPDLPANMRADERRLRQVLINLLANAVRFTDRGWVGLSVTPQGSRHVRFEVSDSGVGMAPDQLLKLFQRFEQVGDSERSAGGTGLGLAISRNLVRLMGGELQVSSSRGVGSTFWFELELNPSDILPGTGAPNRSLPDR